MYQSARRLSSAAVEPRDLRSAFDRPLGGARTQRVGAGGVRGEKRLVGVAFFEQHAMECQRDDDVSARAHRQIEIGVACHGGDARIDDDESGAVLLCGLRNGIA